VIDLNVPGLRGAEKLREQGNCGDDPGGLKALVTRGLEEEEIWEGEPAKEGKAIA
jgi:hypothetical protein